MKKELQMKVEAEYDPKTSFRVGGLSIAMTLGCSEEPESSEPTGLVSVGLSTIASTPLKPYTEA